MVNIYHKISGPCGDIMKDLRNVIENQIIFLTGMNIRRITHCLWLEYESINDISKILNLNKSSIVVKNKVKEIILNNIKDGKFKGKGF